MLHCCIALAVKLRLYDIKSKLHCNTSVHCVPFHIISTEHSIINYTGGQSVSVVLLRQPSDCIDLFVIDNSFCHSRKISMTTTTTTTMMMIRRLIGWKLLIFPTPLTFNALARCDPVRISGWTFYPKSYESVGEDIVILTRVIFTQCQRMTDRQSETDIPNLRLGDVMGGSIVFYFFAIFNMSSLCTSVIQYADIH